MPQLLQAGMKYKGGLKIRKMSQGNLSGDREAVLWNIDLAKNCHKLG